MTMVAAPQSTPYTIDVILPMTGSFAYDGFTDAQTFHVFEAWANAHGGLRGQPIRFDIHDDQSSPALSVQLLTQIARETSGCCPRFEFGFRHLQRVSTGRQRRPSIVLLFSRDHSTQKRLCLLNQHSD